MAKTGPGRHIVEVLDYQSNLMGYLNQQGQVVSDDHPHEFPTKAEADKAAAVYNQAHVMSDAFVRPAA